MTHIFERLREERKEGKNSNQCTGIQTQVLRICDQKPSNRAISAQVRLNPFLPLGQGQFIYLNVGRGLHEGVNHLLADGAVDNVAWKTNSVS